MSIILKSKKRADEKRKAKLHRGEFQPQTSLDITEGVTIAVNSNNGSIRVIIRYRSLVQFGHTQVHVRR